MKTADTYGHIDQRKGTYVLILNLPESQSVTAGRLGTFDFTAGWYAYVGSAFGPGGLRGRLRHHLAPVKKPHWHVDYLRAVAPVREVWALASTDVYEHVWATVFGKYPGAAIAVPRFGASDCRCAAHLIYLPGKPLAAEFHLMTGAQVTVLAIT
ncbi:MAG: GIY-YIG nuclease family protein [Chloroflexota bacterium]